MNKIISIIVTLFVGTQLFGQVKGISGKSITLPDEDIGWVTEAKARDYVELLPGFDYAGYGNPEFYAYIDPNLIVDTEYRSKSQVIDPTKQKIDTNLPVGNSPAVFNVNQMGAANYTVPIRVAPGTAGMQPELAINYSSRGGTGFCGLGAELSGISAISRIGKTIYHDGFSGGIDLSSSDRFAIDGQRLMLTSGTYGSDKSKYKCEIDNFSIIEAFNFNGDYSPEYFIVTAKDGTKMYYGQVDLGSNRYANAYLKSSASDKIISWYLYKVVDIHGNYMIYNYEKDEDEGETWLTSIEYTGNDKANLKPYNKIEFTYEQKQNVAPSYIHGLKISNKKLLKNIRTYAENKLVRKYVLEYFYDDFPKLNEIIEYNSNNEHYNSIVLGWGEKAEEVVSLREKNIPYDQLPKDSEFKFADFNGDGLIDFVCCYHDKGQHQFDIYLNHPKGFYLYRTLYFWDSEFRNAYVYPGDFNGDGLSDLLIGKIAVNGAKHVGIALSTGSDFDMKFSEYTNLKPNIENIQVGDFNGDGKDEFTQLAGNTLYLFSPQTNTNLNPLEHPQNLHSSANIFIRDVDGDGKDEYINIIQHASTLPIDELNIYSLSSSGGHLVQSKQWNCRANFYFGNFNGDGYTDILLYNLTDKNWNTYIYNGKKFIDGPTPDLPAIDMGSNLSTNNLHLRDLNGDGKTDILHVKQLGLDYGSNFRILYSLGESFTPAKNHSTYAEGLKSEFKGFIDLNGDGFEDYLAFSKKGYIREFCFNQNGKNMQINKISDGTGALIDINYEFIGGSGRENGDIYTKSLGSKYPLVNVQPNISLVKGYKKTSGGKIVEDKSFSYKGLKLHAQGRGLLGFSYFTKRDNLRNSYTTDYYALNSDLFYKYWAESISYINDKQVGWSRNIVKVEKRNNGSFWPRVTCSNTNNLINGTIVSIENDVWDLNNGNIISSIKEYKHEGSTIIDAKITTQTQYTTLPGCNYKNAPLLTTVKQKRSVGTSPEIKTRYYYNGVNLDYSIANDGTPYAVKQKYSFDKCGNVTREEIRNTSDEVFREVDYSYDEKKRFVTSVTNGLGHKAIKTYDTRYGKILTKINASGIKTTYKYDNWGNLASVTTPAGTAYNNIKWSNSSTFSNARYYKENISPTGNQSYEFFDYEGRLVATVSKRA